MKVEVKLKELLDADARFISLVKHSASRIPLRVVKTEKGEATMGIDLSSAARLFKATKADGSPAPGTVSGIVVVKDDKLEAVTKAVADAGFSVDKPVDLEAGTVMFEQVADPEANAHVVRLSEHALVMVKSFAPFAEKLTANNGFLSEEAKKEEFFLGTDIVAKAMSQTLTEVMSTDPVSAQKSLKQINTYLETLTAGVPTAAFKLDKALGEIYKAFPPKKDPEDDPAMGGDSGVDEAAEDKAKKADAAKAATKKADMTKPVEMDQAKWDGMSDDDKTKACKAAADAEAAKKAEADKVAKAGGSMAVDGYLEMPPNTDKQVWALMSDDLRKQYAMAAAKVVAPQTSSPSIEELVSNAVKSAAEALKGTLKGELETQYKSEIEGLTTMVKNLTLAVDGVTKNYKDLTTQLGLTTQKADKLEATVKGTVTAPAPQENDPPAWDVTKKSSYDEEWIVDTAMQGRRLKHDRAAAA